MSHSATVCFAAEKKRTHRFARSPIRKDRTGSDRGASVPQSRNSAPRRKRKSQARKPSHRITALRVARTKRGGGNRDRLRRTFVLVAPFSMRSQDTREARKSHKKWAPSCRKHGIPLVSRYARRRKTRTQRLRRLIRRRSRAIGRLVA